MTIRVLLADDQALLRGTLRLLLDSVPELTVVGEGHGLDKPAEAKVLQTLDA